MSLLPIFRRYIQIGEVLGQMFPNILEVVVHDFSNLDKSVIFIANGHISGRKVGSGASELGLRRLLETENTPDLLVNCGNLSGRGNRLKSSSIAIRDGEGRMIGAFCLNFDISLFEHFQHFLTSIVSSEVGEEKEKKETSIEEEIRASIQEYLVQHGLAFSQLSYTDKQKIVAHLEQKISLKQRGVIMAIANALQLTRQSIYNYLNQSSYAKKELNL